LHRSQYHHFIMSAICEELSFEEARQPIETLVRQTFAKDSNGCIAWRVIGDTGGGEATSLTPISLTEAQAITAIGASTLTPGARYQIQLDGTSQGAASDVVATVALANNLFSQHVDYYHNGEGRYVCVEGVFDATGWTIKRADMSAEIVSTSRYNGGTETLDITGYEVFGVHIIAVPGGTGLVQITDAVGDGLETRLYGTGGVVSSINVGGGNVLTDVLLGAFTLYDDNLTNITFRKRGSNWIEAHRSAMQ
jgi:hypothetical protein